MLTLSHRGYHATAPENTIEAFAQAEQMGVDGIETDLRVTRDGKLVLFHDRATPDGRAIAALTHQELCEAVRYPVPTAAEAVAGCDSLLWNLEIKVPEALDPALELVRQFGESNRRFLITSFWHNVVAECAQRLASDDELAARDQIDCGLLTADRPLDLQAIWNWDAAGLAAIVWYYEILDPPLLAEARRRGVANYAYGVKTVEDHARCLELGLDAVITDHPQFMAEARLQRGGA